MPHHRDNAQTKIKINQLNPRKETIPTEEEFSQKDKLLLMLLSNTSYKFNNNNKTKRDMNSKCKNYIKNNSKWQIRNKDKPK